jgi:hypothetical protein
VENGHEFTSALRDPVRAAPPSRLAVKTFCEIYCADRDCPPEDFPRRVFWHCLHGIARPIAPFALWLFPSHFDADWSLIMGAAQCRTMAQIDEEIHDFAINPANRGWQRRQIRVRISSARLRQLARRSLRPAAPSQPVAAP